MKDWDVVNPSATPFLVRVVIALNDWSGLWRHLSQLEDGWDSYHAPAPSSLSIEKSRAMVDELAEHCIVADRISPSVIGGVGITIYRNKRKSYIEIRNDGNMTVMHCNDVGEIEVNCLQTMQNIASEIRKKTLLKDS